DRGVPDAGRREGRGSCGAGGAPPDPPAPARGFADRRRPDLYRPGRDRLSPDVAALVRRSTDPQQHGNRTMTASPAQEGPLRLHVGGQQAKAGWKIVDIEARPEVDFVADCTALGMFADGSVDELYASHIIEHLGHAG